MADQVYVQDAAEGDTIVFTGDGDTRTSFCDFEPGSEAQVEMGEEGNLVVKCTCGAWMRPELELDVNVWKLVKRVGPW